MADQLQAHVLWMHESELLPGRSYLLKMAARTVGVSYPKLIGQLHKAGIDINRKMLAEIAISDPVAFAAIAKA